MKDFYLVLAGSHLFFRIEVLKKSSSFPSFCLMIYMAFSCHLAGVEWAVIGSKYLVIYDVPLHISLIPLAKL